MRIGGRGLAQHLRGLGQRGGHLAGELGELGRVGHRRGRRLQAHRRFLRRRSGRARSSRARGCRRGGGRLRLARRRGGGGVLGDRHLEPLNVVEEGADRRRGVLEPLAHDRGEVLAGGLEREDVLSVFARQRGVGERRLEAIEQPAHRVRASADPLDARKGALPIRLADLREHLEPDGQPRETVALVKREAEIGGDEKVLRVLLEDHARARDDRLPVQHSAPGG